MILLQLNCYKTGDEQLNQDGLIALFQFSSFFLILSLKDCCQIRNETDLKFKWIKHPIHT